MVREHGRAGRADDRAPAPQAVRAGRRAPVAEREGDLLACGPDPEPVVEQIKEFEQAGFDHLYLHQVGPDQEGFFRFWREELKPRL